MMRYSVPKILLFCCLLLSLSAVGQPVIPAADRTARYFPLLEGKKLALVVNPTSVVGSKQVHLVDTLKSAGYTIQRIFAPEHGFRGDHGAGVKIKNEVDKSTGIPITSLYGSNKKPSATDLADIDLVIFDIQDVGVRFYTYLSTLHYVMEACAENGKPLLILDRPNPNGFYIDGPILDTSFRSFVGMHPVPLVHGLTVGEYARMINGEKWLSGGLSCDIKIIPCENYDHNVKYTLPVRPSPNLPTQASIYLYPSLGLFEGTNVSMGRGTDLPFECIGKPGFNQGTYSFTPRKIPGVAENPPYVGKTCQGFLLTEFANNYLAHHKGIYLYWLQGFYQEDPKKEKFFNDFFDKLAGTDQLRKDIIAGKTPEEISNGWKKGLQEFQQKRRQYLIYNDFTW